MLQSTPFEILIILLGVLAAVLVAMFASQGLRALPLRCLARRERARRTPLDAHGATAWRGDGLPDRQ